MTIQVLGTGCARCQHLFQAAEQAVADAGIPAAVEKVTDIARSLEFSPWALPALAIDGEVRTAGRVLSADEVRAYFPT